MRGGRGVRRPNGQVRRSQVISTYGPGALVDLPEHSAIVGGLDQWLGRARYAQPALFVVEYALAQLWMQWGVAPQMLLGDGVGEYVAATLAGVFCIDDALMLVARRAQLLEEFPPGAIRLVRNLPPGWRGAPAYLCAWVTLATHAAGC